MAIAGEIQYKVVVDTKSLKSGLNEADSAVGSFADKMGQLGISIAKTFGKVVVAGVATATTAIVGLTKQATESFAEYEQLVGGVEKIFGEDVAQTVFKNADNAFKTAGVSANEYMTGVMNFSASLLQSVGGDATEAARVADMAFRDMSDNMNTFGSDMESIQNAYQGFAKQNYTMLDNLKLGYGGTKGEMQRLLKDAEKLTGVHYDISNLKDVYEAIHAIQVETNITGTTEREAVETISGSFGMLKASWQNVLTGIADDTQDFDVLIGNLVESAKTFATNVIPTIRVAIGGVANLVSDLLPIILEQIPVLFESLFPAVIEATQALLTGLVNALPMLLETLLNAIPMVVNAVMMIFQAIMQSLPQILSVIVQIVLAIAQELVKPQNLNIIFQSALDLLMGLIQAIPDIINALAVALPDILSSIITFLLDPANFTKLVEATVQLFMALVTATPMILGALFSAFLNLFSTLWEKLKVVFTNFAGNFGQAIGQMFKNAINGVIGFIESAIRGPINAVNGFLGVINAIPGVNIGYINAPTLPRLASGGIVGSGGRIIMAGEGGEDEWVVPESKMADMVERLNNESNRMGGVTINIEGVFATSDADQRRVAEQIYAKLEEINKSKMGAFL